MAQVTFQQAVATLHSMFEHIDTEVIAAVLESTGYHMEMAIEQLLTLDPGSDSVAPSSEVIPAVPTIPSDVGVPSLRGGVPTSHPRSGSTYEPEGGEWRNPLPPDFLQIPGAIGPVPTSTSTDQMLQDEAIAQMINDELFMEQLRADPQFSRYLGAESAYLGGASSRRTQSGPSGNAVAPPREEGPGLGEKLSEMGANMKRRLGAFALRFRGNKGAPAKASTAAYSSLSDAVDLPDTAIPQYNSAGFEAPVSRGPTTRATQHFVIGEDSDDEAPLPGQPQRRRKDD